MRVIFCGNRNWNDIFKIHAEMRRLPQNTEIVHGGARGADSMAGTSARSCYFRVTVFPAEWEKYGKAAGPIRNRQMLDYLLKYDGEKKVVAFHHNIEVSRGTKDMVTIARRAGVEVRIIT